MKLSRLTQMAKDALDRRGGVEALKEDLKEAQQAASGPGSLADKAKAAAGAFKQPGRDDARAPGAPTPSEPPRTTTPPAEPGA